MAPAQVGNISGTDLEYLYSHAATGTSNASSAAGWGPNQVAFNAMLYPANTSF